MAFVVGVGEQAKRRLDKSHTAAEMIWELHENSNLWCGTVLRTRNQAIPAPPPHPPPQEHVFDKTCLGVVWWISSVGFMILVGSVRPFFCTVKVKKHSQRTRVTSSFIFRNNSSDKREGVSCNLTLGSKSTHMTRLSEEF